MNFFIINNFRMHHLIGVFFLALFSSTFLWAEKVPLEECIQQALMQHPDMQSYRLKTEALQFEQRRLSEEFDPQYRIFGTFGAAPNTPDLKASSEGALRLRSGAEITVQTGASYARPPEFMAVLRQPLSGYARPDIALFEKSWLLDLSVAEKKKLQNHIIQETIQAYLTWLSAQNRRVLLSQALEQAKKLHRDMEHLVRAGRHPAVALSSLEIQVMEQHLQWTRAQEEERSAWDSLCRLTGTTTAMPKDDGAVPPNFYVPLSSLATYLDDSQTFAVQDFLYRHLRNELLLKAAQAEQKTRWDWRTHLSVHAGNEEYVPGVWTGLEWTTPKSGPVARRAAEFYVEQEAEKLSQEEAEWRRRYPAQIEHLFREFTTAQKALKIVQSRAELSLKKTEQMQALWAAERVSIDDWLTARANSIADQIAVQEANATCILAWVALEAYHGTLDEMWAVWLSGK